MGNAALADGIGEQKARNALMILGSLGSAYLTDCTEFDPDLLGG